MGSPREDQMQAAINASETMLKLWRAQFMRRLRQEEHLGAQFGLLHLIGTQGPLHNRKLGEILSITPGAITQMTDHLVEAGLVERQPNAEDRRMTDLSLTAAGREKLRLVTQKRHDFLEQLFDVLSDQELAAYLASQRKMINRLRELQQDSAEEDIS